MAFDGVDSPLRAASLRSPALRSVPTPSPERTGCDPTPDTLDRRAVATASYNLDETGKSSCRAPAGIVDAAQLDRDPEYQGVEVWRMSHAVATATILYGRVTQRQGGQAPVMFNP